MKFIKKHFPKKTHGGGGEDGEQSSSFERRNSPGAWLHDSVNVLNITERYTRDVSDGKFYMMRFCLPQKSF